MPGKRGRPSKKSTENAGPSGWLGKSQKRSTAAFTDSANQLNRAEMQVKLRKILVDTQPCSQLNSSGMNFVSVGNASQWSTQDFDSQDPLGCVAEEIPETQMETSAPSPLNLSLNGPTTVFSEKLDEPENPLTSPLLQMGQDDDAVNHPLFPSEGSVSPEQSELPLPEKSAQEVLLFEIRQTKDAQLPLPQEAVGGSKAWTEEQIPVGLGQSSMDQPTTSASTSVAENPAPDWKALYEKAEDENRELNEKLKKLRKKLATIESDKAASDDLALRYSKKLLDLEDKQKIPTARFTTNPEFNVTVEQLREINERCATDSMFVGMLCIQLLGVDLLKRMSVTGQPSHRFINAKAADGSPVCKTTEKMHPTVVNFICDKVAERTAIRVGAENVATIRKYSDIKAVNRFIATKISNLRKASSNQGTSRSNSDTN